MADDDDPLFVHYNWLPESELADAGRQRVHRLIILTRIVLVRMYVRQLTQFNLHRVHSGTLVGRRPAGPSSADTRRQPRRWRRGTPEWWPWCGGEVLCGLSYICSHQADIGVIPETGIGRQIAVMAVTAVIVAVFLG